MPTPILLKRSTVTGKIPVTSDLALGELALNTTDGKIFMKKSVSGVESIVQVSGVANAAELTGTTLSANVTASSLTSVGTLTGLTVSNPIAGAITGNAGSATRLQTARTINGVAFDGSTNISFFDTFPTGAASPGPQTFQSQSIRGFDAYSSTDFPTSFFSGITITGPGGVRSSQLAMNWNSDENSPTGLYFRTNDDTGTPSTWSAWQRVAIAGEVTPGSSDAASLTGSTLSANVTASSLTSVGTLTGLNISGAIVKSGTSGTGDIGQSANKFGTVYATTFSGTATTAQYADLAEIYRGDADYAPGTVLVFGGDAEVTVTDETADTRVAGVVSTAPAYLMNSAVEGIAVALRGRVPVKVVGRVQKGDLLVTSAIPGHAVSVGREKHHGHAVFAKALEFKDTEYPDFIEAVIL